MKTKWLQVFYLQLCKILTCSLLYHYRYCCFCTVNSNRVLIRIHSFIIKCGIQILKVKFGSLVLVLLSANGRQVRGFDLDVG